MWDAEGRQMTEVSYEVANAVATITLQRPAAMNSMSTAAKVELLEAVSRAAEDVAVRAVVLTGAATEAMPIAKGDIVCARFQDMGSINVRID